MIIKPVILIIYNYFYPGYKAGGPVQSLTNLIISLEDQFEFSVLTTAYDLKENQPYQNIKLNEWNEIKLNGCKGAIKVYYSDIKQPQLKRLKELINQINPRKLYINGIYSFRLFLLPLFVSLYYSNNLKVVICPRGMLQQGALDVKSRKKKYYIKALQLSGLLKNVYWHATNAEEEKDIKKYFPQNKGVTIASNIPKVPIESISILPKIVGELKLVFLSLITEKKNLDLLLSVLKTLPHSITLDIYGPIKDKGYWNECIELINKLGKQVNYLGDLVPTNVQAELSKYHALILLTKGENFGHALYESLSVGRPVITSHFTPWNNLKEIKAGLNVDISSIESCQQAVIELASLNQIEYNEYCNGAYKVASDYFYSLETEKTYSKLFSTTS